MSYTPVYTNTGSSRTTYTTYEQPRVSSASTSRSRPTVVTYGPPQVANPSSLSSSATYSNSTGSSSYYGRNPNSSMASNSSYYYNPTTSRGRSSGASSNYAFGGSVGSNGYTYGSRSVTGAGSGSSSGNGQQRLVREAYPPGGNGPYDQHGYLVTERGATVTYNYKRNSYSPEAPISSQAKREDIYSSTSSKSKSSKSKSNYKSKSKSSK